MLSQNNSGLEYVSIIDTKGRVHSKKNKFIIFLNNSTVRRLKNGTPVFALFQYEILIKFYTQWQF